VQRRPGLPLHCYCLGDDLHGGLFQRKYVVVQSAEALSIMLEVDPPALLKAGDPLAVLNDSRPCEFAEAGLIEPVTRQWRGAKLGLIPKVPVSSRHVSIGCVRRRQRLRASKGVADSSGV
jgi:hypothetical protein